jgi:hypothetical protein
VIQRESTRKVFFGIIVGDNGTYSEKALPLILRIAMAKALDWSISWLEMALSVVLAGWADCTPVMCRQRRAEGAVGCESTRRARRDERGADMVYRWDGCVVLYYD